jgi:transposase
MKPYSSETSEKIVKIYEQGDTSIRKVIARFDVSKGFVQKILKQKRTRGHVQPKKLSCQPSKCVKLAHN